MAKLIFYFLIGICVGSFLNVCIYRWPRNLSVIFPERSFCPWCNFKISWYNNLPLVSFFLLRGRCESCHSLISPRYVFVEILTGILFVAIGVKLDSPLSSFGSCVIVSLALLTTFSDLEWKIIPDQASIGLIFFGILFASFNPFLGSVSQLERFYNAILGMAVGLVVPLTISFLGKLFLGVDVIGMGDIKLIMGYGSVFGILGVCNLMFISCTVGGVICFIGLLGGVFKRKQYLPFGPFINIAAIILLFFHFKMPVF